MGDEPFTTLHGSYTRGSGRSTTNQIQIEYAAQRARVLFGSYRRGNANDPETYVATIAAVLEKYPTDVIREATDPNTGIQTLEKFLEYMPNAGQLKRHCDDLAVRKERMKKFAALPNVPRLEGLGPHDRPPGFLANLFVPQGHARYSKLVEWSKDADPKYFRFGESSDNHLGIWVALSVWEGGTARTTGLIKMGQDDDTTQEATVQSST